ncbi:MAG: hypothetical protein ACXQTC_04905 [Methanopyraceae archaeon]
MLINSPRRGQVTVEYGLILLVCVGVLGAVLSYVWSGLGGAERGEAALEAKSMAEQLADVLEKAAECDDGTVFKVYVRGRPGSGEREYRVRVEGPTVQDEYEVVVFGHGVEGRAKFFSGFGVTFDTGDVRVPGRVVIEVHERNGVKTVVVRNA